MSDAVLATTSLGTVRGLREAGLSVFRGIPFAEPPVGARRLRPPRSLETFDGQLDAMHFGPAAPQTSDPLVTRLGLFPEEPISEDCLRLNVWTPACDDAARPVLVWIHGGAFIGGAASVPVYFGDVLAARGDVVVVTVNYRVGALGFACLPEASGGANFGLLDQIEALRFVKREIAAFGGDPECVTVFGESAGAGSITSLLGMPQASGLFERAIIQSAAPDGMIEPGEGLRRTGLLLAKLGRAETDFEALREVDLEALLAAQRELAGEGPYAKGMLYLPVVDGRTLPEAPLRAIAKGAAAGVDVMIGTTRDEMRLFDLVNPTAALPDALLEAIVAAQLPTETVDRAAEGRRVVDRYREIHTGRGEPAGAGDLFCAIQTDLAMRHPATQLAALHSRAGGRAHMYLFGFRSPIEGGSLGSCHALDLPFVFGNLDARGMVEFVGDAPEARRLSEAMMDAWIAFARSGDPSHDAIGAWPRYDAELRATMCFESPCAVVQAPFEAERRLWEQVSPESRWT